MKVKIIGMGALGVMYANYIKERAGEDAVCFVMDSSRLKRYEGQVFLCNKKEQTFCMEDSEKAEKADLVIVAVKYNGLASAIETMRHCVGDGTIIMSVMNGISSEDRIAAQYGADKMIYTVAQGMDAMKFGNELKYTQMGELRIGAKLPQQEKNVEAVSKYFDEIQMPYQKDADIMHRIWGKFMLNVGVNQTCMTYGTNYAGVLREGEAHDTMIAAMEEVIALGNAEGIALTGADRDYYVGLLETLDPEGIPSMAQDRVSRRHSEVEMFAGTVIELGKKHQIPVPANERLYQMVQEIEKEY